MINRIKFFLRPFYIPLIEYTINSINLYSNFSGDLILFKKYSLLFRNNNFENKEADIILNYHSIEKGMLFKNMKKGFAEYRIRNLHKILSNPDIIQNVNKSQVKVGYQIICRYYELHQDSNYDINDFYTKEQYEFYKSILAKNYHEDFNGIIEWSKKDFLNKNKEDFYQFAHSRKSVRDFSGDKIDLELIQNVVELANTSPSVCNRQASNVYLIEDKVKIDEILKIQAGFTGYSDNVSQLLVVTNDRKYYYTVGERYQFYIDGGLYLMNLLYALHYYGIGNCPANWGKTKNEDRSIRKIIDIPISEQIICLVPIGVLKEKFRTTLSVRRDFNENLKIFK